ncbi:MAG: 3-ketoacyl-CoA thiolase [Myxococcota bacterium]|nr:3-ketoacyl-CoA thiolase [Myxococcota bacterium]
MEQVVIVSACRTPVGRAIKGVFKDTRPDDLLAAAIREAVRRAEINPSDVEDVICGCSRAEGPQGKNIARYGALLAGLPASVPASTLARACASGLHAMAEVAARIASGEMETGVACGVESMTHTMAYAPSAEGANPRLMAETPGAYATMGMTAENVASQFGISRAEQDRFALASQQKAGAALQSGRFADEIAAVKTSLWTQEGESLVEKKIEVTRDECPRPETTLEGLAKLKPAFLEGGSVTAGNSSTLSDGSAACVMMSAREARRRGLRPLGVFRGFAVVGVDPAIMGIGPIPAVKKLFARTGLSMDQIDLVELNEAFASQAVCCARELGIPKEKLNVNGGAIALGHPLGATGVKLSTQILYELRRRGLRRGLVTMCVAGGMGAAAILETAE